MIAKSKGMKYKKAETIEQFFRGVIRAIRCYFEGIPEDKSKIADMLVDNATILKYII